LDLTTTNTAIVADLEEMGREAQQGRPLNKKRLAGQRT